MLLYLQQSLEHVEAESPTNIVEETASIYQVDESILYFRGVHGNTGMG